jgi:hypothetical protein
MGVLIYRDYKNPRKRDRRDRMIAKRLRKAARKAARKAVKKAAKNSRRLGKSLPPTPAEDDEALVYGIFEASSSSEGLLFDADDIELGQNVKRESTTSHVYGAGARCPCNSQLIQDTLT